MACALTGKLTQAQHEGQIRPTLAPEDLFLAIEMIASLLAKTPIHARATTAEAASATAARRPGARPRDPGWRGPRHIGWLDPVGTSLGTAEHVLKVDHGRALGRPWSRRAVRSPASARSGFLHGARPGRSCGGDRSSSTQWVGCGWLRSKEAPSTSTSGRIRSSQPGSHQARSPARCISRRDEHHAHDERVQQRRRGPGRSRSARITLSSLVMNPPNTEIMMIAATATTVRAACNPRRTAIRAGDAVDVGLAHPGDQEQLVVHRQAEQHPDEERRQEAEHRTGVVDAEQRREPAPLEDRR